MVLGLTRTTAMCEFALTISMGATMKKTLLAVTLSTALFANAGHAGTLADPILEEDLIEAATASDGGILVPIIFLILALPSVAN